MPERFMDRIRRKWTEFRIKALQRIFKWAIERYDRLSVGAFMAFSWGVDETTDYHVIAERSYPDHHVFGTKVTWYDAEPPKEVQDGSSQ